MTTQIVRIALGIGLAWMVGAGAPAGAGVLTSASWISQLPVLPLAPAVPVPISASGTSTGVLLNVGLSLPAFEVSPVVPTSQIFVFEKFTLAGGALLTAGPGLAVASKAIPGSASIRIASATKLGGKVPATTIVRVPLAIGVDGSHMQTFFFLGATNYLTAFFYDWTVNSRTFTGLTLRGDPLPDAVAMGSFALTPNGGGTVTLVSPTRIHVTDSGPAVRNVVSFDTLTLHFVPEPSALTLLAGALVALSALRRRAA